MFSNLRADERLSLLHVSAEAVTRSFRLIFLFPQEGPGVRTLSAYVEIVFNNTDRRFPVRASSVPRS